MKVLVLDDEKCRHEAFQWRYADHEIHHAWNPIAAVALLAESVSRGAPFDLASLDHDLSHHRLTGQDVAWFIVNMPAAMRPREVIVHSWNPDGARAMVAILAGHVGRLRKEPYQGPAS